MKKMLFSFIQSNEAVKFLFIYIHRNERIRAAWSILWEKNIIRTAKYNSCYSLENYDAHLISLNVQFILIVFRRQMTICIYKPRMIMLSMFLYDDYFQNKIDYAMLVDLLYLFSCY